MSISWSITVGLLGVHTSRQAEHLFVVVLMIVCGQKECQHLDPDPTGTSLRFGREWKTNATCFNSSFSLKLSCLQDACQWKIMVYLSDLSNFLTDELVCFCITLRLFHVQLKTSCKEWEWLTDATRVQTQTVCMWTNEAASWYTASTHW